MEKTGESLVHNCSNVMNGRQNCNLQEQITVIAEQK